MPNWCHNKIQFKGGDHLDDIKNILNNNPDGILDFEDFDHNPDQRLDGDSQWIEIDENEININCLTGWSPPISFLQHMSLMFPGTEITLQYCEASNAIAGEATFEANIVNHVRAWSEYLGNWDNPSLSDLEDEEIHALFDEMWDEDFDTDEMKEAMDKVYNKHLSDFMYDYFQGPVGG